ncbi:MAG: hypothetical protein VCA55_03515 [Verrucomicrobiales bacterium]
MANSSNPQQNRNRNRNRNRQGTHSGGGQRRFVKQKVPRRTGKPSLWEKFCAIFTLGTKRPSPPKRQSPDNTRARSKKSAANPSRGRKREDAVARKSEPPEKVAVTTSRLYVGNLSYDTTENDLATLFEKVGGVVKAEIVCHRSSNRSKGYAFVEMNDTNGARKAADALHDHDFMGRKIIVNGAKSAGPQGNQET